MALRLWSILGVPMVAGLRDGHCALLKHMLESSGPVSKRSLEQRLHCTHRRELNALIAELNALCVAVNGEHALIEHGDDGMELCVTESGRAIEAVLWNPAVKRIL